MVLVAQAERLGRRWDRVHACEVHDSRDGAAAAADTADRAVVARSTVVAARCQCWMKRVKPLSTVWLKLMRSLASSRTPSLSGRDLVPDQTVDPQHAGDVQRRVEVQSSHDVDLGQAAAEACREVVVPQP